ncbi:MAG: SpoIIE family protein phosphatase [Spirochaetes bacterium]|nr:SpoIIE family protein phosphatase [Spirochaetota bacterium]
MPGGKRFLALLTARLEGYTFLVVIPLSVYFVVISGETRGYPGEYVITGALIAGPVTLVVGLLARIRRLWPYLTYFTGGHGAERGEGNRERIRKLLLMHPVWEATVITIRWFAGISMASWYVWHRTGMFGGVEFALGMLIAVPSSFAIFYFTSENVLSRVLKDERLGDAPRDPGDGRVFGLFGRTILTLVSAVSIPAVVFGHFFYLSQEGMLTMRNANLHIGVIAAFSLMVILIIAYESSVSIRLAVRLVVGALEKLREGDLAVRIPLVSRGEIGVIGRHVNHLADSLSEFMKKNRELTDNLERKVARRTEELHTAMEELTAANEHLREARDELWGEMELAKRIQTVLLPACPGIEGYDLAVRMEPAAHVGGDYYDVIKGAAADWVVIGDVSGHGMTAGLVMMMAQTAIHATLKINPGIDPLGLLEAVNGVIYQNTRRFSEEKFMTLTAIAVGRDGEMRYAGLHEDILVYRAARDSVEVLETDGIWIGMIQDIRGRVTGARLRLEPGDVMLLHTDGVVNAWARGSVAGNRSLERDSFGQRRLVGALERRGGESASAVLTEIMELLEDYRREDDATLLVIRRTQ